MSRLNEMPVNTMTPARHQGPVKGISAKTPARPMTQAKGISVKTPARPKAPTFSVYTDVPLKLDSPKKKSREEKEELEVRLDTHLSEEEEEGEDEEYDFGPAEKAGLSDDLSAFEPIDWLTPEYESIVLKESDDYQPKESEIFIRFKLPAICESEEFDLEAFNREYADILEDLKSE